MVRETRHLWVGNLPDNVREDRIREHFKRYGRVQSVKLLSRGSSKEPPGMGTESNSGVGGGGGSVCGPCSVVGSGGLACTVAFMDIKSAAKAHTAEHKLDERTLTTEYYEPVAITSPAASPPPGPPVSVVSVQSGNSNAGSLQQTQAQTQQRFNNSHSVHHERPNEEHSFFYDRLGASGVSNISSVGGDYLRRGPVNSVVSGYLDSSNGAGTRGRARDRLYRGTTGGNGATYTLDRPSRAWGYDPPLPQTPPNTRYTSGPLSTLSPVYGSGQKKATSAKSRSGSESPVSPCDRSVSRSSESRSRSSSPSTSSGSRLTVTDSPAPQRRPLAVCVRNLPTRSSDTSLKDGLFHEYKKHGKVTWVKVVGQSADRYAVVCFKRPEDAEKALEASYDKLFFGCKIDVAPHQGYTSTNDIEGEPPRPYEAELDEFHPKATRTLFVGNLDKDVTSVELRKHFEPFGRILEIDVKKQGAAGSYAFCQFADITSVVRAIRGMDGEHIGTVRVKLGFGKSMPSNCVWVDGIVDSVNEKHLTGHFHQFGPITQVSIDRSRGQALVFFEQAAFAQAAVKEMRGIQLRGRRLQVDFASRECQDVFYESVEKQVNSVYDTSPVSRFRYDAIPRTRTSSYTRQNSACSNIRPTTRYSDYYEYEQDCGSSPSEDAVRKRSRGESDHNESITTITNSDCRTGRRRSSCASRSAATCKRRKASREAASENDSDGSRPGTPLCDERPEAQPPSEPRRVAPPRSGHDPPLSLPLPKFAAQFRAGPQVVPPPVHEPPPASPPPFKGASRPPSREHSRDGTKEVTRNSKDFHISCPVRESVRDCVKDVKTQSRPPSRAPSDSSDSDVPPASPSLEERIRSLDEKYEKWSGSRVLMAGASDTLAKIDAAVSERFRFRHKLLDLDLRELPPSEIVKSVLAKRSVFDEDSKRLENFGEKYEPSATQLRSLPGSGPKLPPAKGLQYPFPSHPPTTPPSGLPPPVSPLMSSVKIIMPTKPVGSVTTTALTAQVKLSAVPVLSVSSSSVKTTSPTQTLISLTSTTLTKSSVTTVSTSTIVKTTVSSVLSVPITSTIPSKPATSAIPTVKLIASVTHCASNLIKPVIHTQPTTSTNPTTTLPSHAPRISSIQTDHACKVTVKNDKVLKEPVVVLLNSARKEHRSSKCERDADNVECDKKKDSDVCDKKVEVKEDKEEQLEKERLEKERLQEERLEEEKLEKERIEKAEKERLENEKAEKEKQERLAKEHEDKELRDKEEKESEKREQLEREKQEKQKQIKEEEQLQKEREECLEREYVEKECLLKEKIEKPEKVEETHEKGHKEDSHELKKDIIKHKENNTLDEFKIRRDSYTDARTNERCKENFDTSKSHQDTVKKEYESKNHEISRTNHDRRDDQHNYKERYHSEKDESPLKLKELSIKKEKENRDLNYHDKKYSESTKHGEPKHIENRHSSLDNDKSRQYSEHNTNLSTNPLKEKKKERSNSSPVSIGIKRHIGSQDGLDSLIEDSKRIKLDHKKILDRRNSKDKSKHMRHKSVDEKVKDEKRIKDSGDERRRDEREQDKHKLKQKSEKHKSKNKDKLIQSPTICKMPNKELTLDKDFLARLELRTNEEMEEKRIKKEKRSKLDEERKNSLDEKYEEKKKEKHERKPSRDESVTSSKSDDRKSKKEDKRKMTNSSDTTDSDEPKKHSIFDIVDDEPAYISMYDKVKARSCKNMQKQEEEKRQEKIKAKFSQLKQSRAKREEKKRSTSWEEDSDSDHSGHERPGSKQGSNRRGNKMLITSSSEDESGMKKPRKIRTDYTDSEKSERHTSDDEHRLKSLTRKGSKSRITSDSEDEKPKIKLEIFSDHEFDERYKKQIEIKDERIDISFDQDNKYIKKSPNKNMMHVSDDEMRKILSENIKMEVYDVDEIKQENNKFNNRSLICDASSESEIYITDKKNGFSDKTESRKKHKKKQKRQKNISIDDDNHHTDDVETTEREDSFHEIKISMERKKHSKKEKKRDKVKDECGERVRDRTKKSKKTFKPELGLKSEIASSVKHDDKMQDIFGPFSDDSEIGYSTKEIIPNNGNNKPVDSFFDRYTSKLQVSVIYGSDSDSMSNIEAVQSSVFNEKDEKEDCKQRKEKKKKDKIICEENENSVDLVEAGRALEAKLLDVSNEELKIDDLNTKTDLSDETKTETIESDVFKFTDGDDSPETDKKEIERKDSKEKKKKRKKSKDEKHNRKEHHHHHYHHDVEDKKVITETDTKVSKKDTTIEEKLPMQSPSLPSIIDICSPPKSNSDVQNLPNLSGLPTPSLEVNSDISVDKNDLSTVKSPNSKETLLNQISKTPTSEKKKFIPGFGTEIDEKIHESAVKSISDFGSSPVTLEEEVPAPDESKIDKNIESVDDKPRVVISQEETEDAVAALLGESFGGTESEFDSYNTVESPSNENPSESAIPEDDEEMRQAVQSLNASDTETKPDTPQSEHDLQIDTDTEGEEISTTSYDQLPKTPDFTQPPKTPDVPTHYYDNIPVKSMETPVAISTIKTPPIHNVDKPVAITEVPKDVVCRSIEPDLKEKRELPLPPLAKIEDNNSEKTPKSVITSGWSTEPKQVDNIKDKLLVSVPATVKVPTIVTKPSITLQNKQYLTPPTINIPDSNLYSKSPILSPENISKLPPKISMPILTTVNSQIQIRNIPIRIQPPARILSPIVTNPSPLSRLPVPVPIVKQNVILPPSKLPTSTENSCLPKLETPVRLAFSTANVPLRLPHSPVTPTLSSASPPRSMPPLSSIQQMSPIIHRFVNLTPIIKEPPSKSNVAVVEPSVPISSTVSVMTSAVRSIKTYETNIPPVEPKSVSSIIQQLPVIKTTISELPTATKVSESLPVVTTKVDLSKEETKISTPSPVIVSNPNQETVKQEINTDKDPKDLVLKEETKAENITQMQNTPVVCSAEISENKVINSLKIATEEVDLMLKKEETVKEETDKKNIIDIKEEESVVEPKIPECNEITAEPSLLKTEPSESVKELDDDKMEDAESGISDMSKDTMRLSADILENKDDPLDSKDDSYYWSKEVNIDYVIKKVDAICSADELSEESEIEKDEWFDSENKLPETESKSSISLSDISPNKSLISDVSKPITTIVNTMIEYETDPPKTFNEMTETVEDKGSTRGSKRGGRLRGRKNQSNQSLGRGGVQTRRGRKDSPRLRGIIQNRGAGRVGRVDRNKKKTDSELSSDVYEFRDDSDENKDRPRLIFTIKSPATNIAVKDSTPTKEIIPAKVDARTDFASPATNTRKSKRLQERDVSRNTVDEIIEDVVRNKAVVTRSASAALAKRTRQTKSNVSTETRKSPRGNRKGKDQRVSETNDDFSDEKVLKKTETSVDLEVKPETNILNKVIEKSTDKEMVQPTKSETSIVPQHGLKAAVLRRLKGETEEPQTLIDPVTGVLMIMKESEEGQYIPISTATISAESTSIITTRPLLEPTVNKVEISLPRTQSQPNLSTVLTSSIDTLSTITTPAQQIQTKPHTLKAHVLSSQAAKSNIVHVLSTTSSVYQQTPIIHSTVVKQAIPNKTNPQILSIHTSTANQKSNIPIHSSHLTHVANQSNILCLPTQPVVTKQSNMANIPNQSTLPNQPNVPNLPNQSSQSNLSNIPVLNQHIPISQHLNVNVSLSTTIISPNLSPRLGPKPPLHNIKSSAAQSPMSPKQHLLQAAKGTSTKNSVPIPPIPKSHLLNAAVGHINKSSVTAGGVGSMKQHGLHVQQQIMTGAVASPPPALKHHLMGQQPIVTGASSGRMQTNFKPVGATEPPKQESSCLLVPHPTISPQIQARGQIMQAGMPVPAYEANLGDSLNHLGPPLPPAHYVPTHVYQYLRPPHSYQLSRSPHMGGGIEKYGDGQEGEEAPVTSPPLELRRPGSTGASLAVGGPHRPTSATGLRTTSVPHSLQSPHERATDSPQVAQVYMHGTRGTHYGGAGGSRYFETAGDPPPAHRSYVPLGPPGPPVRHGAADAPVSQRGLLVATPPHASQVPSQVDSLHSLLSQRYPVLWQGLLALKNDQAAVQMHYVFGNPHVARDSLPCNSDGSTPPLRIAQRMRLEQTQIDGVARKMQMENEHCMLLALPCGRDCMDVLQQSTNLQNGFITYLQQKQAAGIVNIAEPGSQQAAYVVHIFPSCEFANENLARIAPDLLHRVAEITHLLIIIATV